ncbi:MAG: N-acetylmuramoyl-L-alanine amidase [Thermomicrobiales bacterium]|nr:N-acetylmuramoyl-L-alanine amidase [Thermomicrobiales bacterium]
MAALSGHLLRAVPVAAAPIPIGTDVVVATDRLNLRVGPGLSRAVLRVLVEGTRATVTGRSASSTNDGIDWHRIETAGGNKGWVAGQYLKIDKETTFAVGSVVEVATDFLNLRATGGLSGTVRGVLAQGDRGVVVSGPVSRNGYAWYRLDTDADGDADGWVVGIFLAKASGGFKVGDAVRVGDGPLNVRAAAGLNARVIDRVSEGALFQIRGGPTVKDGYTWMKVFNYGTGTGWIAAEFLILEPDGFPLEGP